MVLRVPESVSGWVVDWTMPWFHGSDKKLTSLMVNSTITQVQALAEVFAHRPKQVVVTSDGTVEHDGDMDGFLYIVDEAVSLEDVEPVPNSTMPSGLEWHIRRPLRIRAVSKLPLRQS